MKVMPLSEVKARLSELVDVVERRDEPLTVTRNGKAVAVLVSPEEYDRWHETVEILHDREFLAEIRDGLRRLSRTKTRRTIDELFEG